MSWHRYGVAQRDDLDREGRAAATGEPHQLEDAAPAPSKA